MRFAAALLAALVIAGTAHAQEPRDLGRSEPAATGLDPQALAAALDELGRMSGTRVALVARHGRLVASRTWRGASLDAPHDIKSASKSLLGAVVGIALERGILPDLDQPLREALPERAPLLAGSRQQITLRHLLEMRPGLESTSGDAYGRWVSSPDWVAHALTRPLAHPPGTVFTYSTGSTHVLSAVLARAAGKDTKAVAQDLLLEPLGISVSAWASDPQGLSFGGNSVRMRAKDMLVFGQAHLDGGRFGGRQVIPEAWVAASTAPISEGWPERYGSYGMTWWQPPEDPGAFMAVGYGGQFVYISRPRDTVIVLFSDHRGKGAEWDRDVLAIFRRIGG